MLWDRYRKDSVCLLDGETRLLSTPSEMIQSSLLILLFCHNTYFSVSLCPLPHRS
jgi:hypothetical protein